MSEIFVSPGVYVRERDFSYYVSSVGSSSLALIGETEKGPAFLPVKVTNMGDFREKFGDLSPTKPIGYCAKSYFKYANSAYIVRVLGADSLRGTTNLKILPIIESGGTVIATLLVSGTPAYAVAATGATTPAVFAAADGEFYLKVTGIYSGYVNVSNTSSPNYIETLFPRNRVVGSVANGMATQHVFPTAAAGKYISGASGQTLFTIVEGEPLDFESYRNARSPVIVGNVTDNASYGTSLFTIYSISDGAASNRAIKVAIENIDTANTVFDLVVRDYADTNASPVILESFPKLSMDAAATNYICKMIGDNKDEKLSNYAQISKYIYVQAESENLAGLLPYGFNPIPAPLSGSVSGFPQFAMVTTYTSTTSMRRQWLGVNYATTDPDMLMYGHSSEWDIDGLSTRTIKGFHLNSGASTTYYQVGPSASTRYDKSTAKFVVPVFGGSDGWLNSANSRALLSATPTTSEETQWKAALDMVANTEEYDINILAVPGVAINNAIGTYAIETAEDRADCIYIGDMPSIYTTAAGAANSVASIDSNYAATYWPYVKIYDEDNQRDVTMPPTPQVLEALAYTDSVAYPWFAPAGMNRGMMPDVLRAQYKLTQDDRETLYEGKVNPIATFGGQGTVIWGQKTLQTRTTALDRVNVRRLLLYVEKVIAGASKYLVFEQNDETTWDRFKGMVQPVLDVVKIKRGLVDFRVIMDETTNTPDMIDRNQLVGQIYLRPTKTAEAILINFNVLPQGSVFIE